MTSAFDCREIRPSLGVYVLGAIDPAERALVDEHLAGCAGCREELAGLAGLPALLRKVPLAEAERLAAHEGSAADGTEPSPDLLPALLARASAQRRARRWRSLAAAAAVVAVAGGGGVAVASGLHLGTPVAASGAQPSVTPTVPHTGLPTATGSVAPGPPWRTLRANDGATGIQLTVKDQPTPWGMRLMVQVLGAPPGITCQFEVVDHAGRHTVASTWQSSYATPDAWYQGSTAVTQAQLRGFVLMSGPRILAEVRGSS